MRFFASLLLLVTSALALSLRADHVLVERRTADPATRSWKRTRKLEADRVLPLRIGLRQQNTHLVDELLMDIAHPESASFGQHWTPERLADFFAPESNTVDAVLSWLDEYGLKDRARLSTSKGWLQLDATVAETEELLGTEYHVYTHSSGVEQISCDEYHVPGHIFDHIELVGPTVHFNHHIGSQNSGTSKRGIETSPGPKTVEHVPKLKSASDLSMCDQVITPDCLRALYSIDYKPVATANNSFGIFENAPQAYVPEDLDIFFGNYSRDQVGQRPTFVSIDGGALSYPNQSYIAYTESNLDLQYAMTLTNPQPVTLLQTGDFVQIHSGSYNNWLDAVDGSYCTADGGDDPAYDGIYPDTQDGGYKGPAACGIIKPPHVISVSYATEEAYLTAKYAQRQCTEYGKLGLLGTSVLYSSGDHGVSWAGICLGPDHQLADGGEVFNPSFPSGCPYVTSVGGTQIAPNKTVSDPEVACETEIYSGGGFSNIFTTPDYQKADVASYLKNHPPPYTSGEFNSTGRAYPDLSANAANYVIAESGAAKLVYGTSASAPVVASIITLINDARLAKGKNPVGFINPSIYSPRFRSAFHDITQGSNPGCGTLGFNATQGWDPVTGVGTPNMTALLPLFLSLP